MSRTVSMSFTANTSQAVKGLNNILEKLKKVNEEYAKFSKDGKGYQFDFSTNAKQIAEDIKVMNTNLKETTKGMKTTAESTKGVKEGLEKVGKKAKKGAKGLSAFQSSLTNLYLMTGAIGMLRSLNTTFLGIEQATFDVGVASQMTIGQIDNLKSSFLSLSSTVPSSAQSLAEAVNELVRTGRSYNDAMMIVNETAKLATASGDDLKQTAQIVTKVMVSLGISGEHVGNTLTTLHSTAIQTASSMQGLADAFKNVASSASLYVNASGKIGDDLDEYKQKVLDISMASIGTLNNMGTSASVAGTKVKIMLSKMVSMEKTARNLFDTATKFNNIKVSDKGVFGTGDLLTAERLASIAKKDLPTALNIMSKLYTQGVLTDQVMQKIFTGRHFMDVSAIFREMNGNVQDFTDSITKGVNYIEDFQKQMFNLNNQWKVFVNQVASASSAGWFSFKESMTGSLMFFNEILSQMPDKLKNMVASTIAMTGACVALGAIIGNLVRIIPLFIAMMGHPAVLAITALSGVLVTLGANYYRTQKAMADFQQTLSKQQSLIKQIDGQMGMIAKSADRTSQSFKDFSLGKGLVDDTSVALGMLDQLISKSKELKNIVETNREVSEMGFLSDPSEELGRLRSEAEEIRKNLDSKLTTIDDLRDEGIRLITAHVKKGSDDTVDSLELEKKFIDMRTGALSATFLNIMDVLQDGTKLMEEYEAVTKEMNKNGDVAISIQQFLIEKVKERGSAESDIKTVLNETGDITLKIKDNIDASTIASDSLKKVFDQINLKAQEIQKHTNAMYSAINSLISYTAGVKLDIFEKTGMYEGKAGLAGMQSLFESGAKNAHEQQLSYAQTQLEIARDLYKEKSVFSSQYTEEEIANAKKEFELKDKMYQELSQKKFEYAGLTESDMRTILGGDVSRKDMSKYIDQLVKINELKTQESDIADRIARAPESNKMALKQQLERTREARLETEKQLQIDKSIRNEKSNTNVYALNYMKINTHILELQQSLDLIGASRVERERVIYQYKLQQYDLDKKEAQSKGDVKLGQLRKAGLSTMGSSLSTLTKEDISRLKAMKDSLEGQGSASGELGGKASSQLKAIQEVLQAYYDYVHIDSKPLIESLSRIDSLYKSNLDTMYQLKIQLSSVGSAYDDFFGVTNLDSLNEQKAIAIEKYKNTLADINREIQDEISKSISTGTDNLFIDMLFGGDGDFDISSIPDEKLKNIVTSLQERMMSMRDTILTQSGVDATSLTEGQKQAILETNDAYMETAKWLDYIQRYNEGRITQEQTIVSLLEKQNENIDKTVDRLQNLSNMMIQLSQATGSKMLGGLGGLIGGGATSWGALEKQKSAMELWKKQNKDTSWIDALTKSSENFANFADTVGGGINIGVSMAGLVGNGSQSSQAGGALGGLAGSIMSGAGMLTGGWGVAIQAGLGAVGSLLGGMSKDDTKEKADKFNKEQAKIYQANTDALNKLSQNMSALSSGVDGLNSSLISSFSKIPTFGNITNVTDAMKSLNKTLLANRAFEEVAYQVTKTKKGKKGFMGIGATADSSWNETIKVSVQEMLNKYGFKGTIYDMTSQQIRDFSKWLDKYDMGDSDNFSILAGALEDYAESMDSMEKYIDNFAKDVTMEGFVGISSLKQEELRQQIEDFYKNLGLQIDEGTKKEIDKLAEQMSVMVTVMQDVRGQFLDVWRDTGISAGDAFLKSMSPYIDAMLNNISQIFYDVYFSDVTEKLEGEFKAISEKLVELKKQGADLKWDDVAGAIGNSFDKVIQEIISAKQNTESFNDILLELQKRAQEAGLSLSEMGDLGLLSGTQKKVLDTFTEALKSTEQDGAIKSFGTSIGGMIGDAISKKMMDTLFSDKILEFSAQVDKVMSGSMSFEELAKVAQMGMSVGLQMEQERMKYQSLMSMFDYNKDINYVNENQDIQYSSGSTQSIINNYNLTSKVEAGVIVYRDDLDDLVGEMMDTIIEKLRVDKGIIL